MKVKREHHGEHRKRLARVSHEHTPLPLPTCLFSNNLITTKDFKSENLKKYHTHSARHRVEKFAFSGCLGKELKGICIDQSL